MRPHGSSKRRVWRKIHIALNVKTLCIADLKLNKNSVDDAKVACEMLTKNFEGSIEKALGDGTFDKIKMYRANRNNGGQLVIPPAHNARLQISVVGLAKAFRDHEIMYRFKTTFSDRLQYRGFQRQSTEVVIKTKILNHFAKIGFGAYANS